MSGALRAGLRELAGEMPPVRPDRDPWATGRRQRRRARVSALCAIVTTVLLAAAGLPLALHADPRSGTVSATEASVPGQVEHPWFWQATVAQSPHGPAALLFSGGGSLGLRGIDGPDHEAKVAVVGRDGSYRMLLRGGAEAAAGEDVRLSPDGRYVVQDFVNDAPDGWLVVTDLVDGRSRALAGPGGTHCCGWPVAWAPDGRSLLALDSPPVRDDEPDLEFRPARLVLADLAAGTARVLLDSVGGDRWGARTASLAAFSPDGELIAVTVGSRLTLIDRTGRERWSRDLGPRRVLAGVGAFSPDGRRITTVTLDGCLTGCDSTALAGRTWRVGQLDAATGQDAAEPGLAPLRGQAVRALGWRSGTDLVTLRYQPEPGRSNRGYDWNDTGYWETGHVQLVALRPGGGVEVLLDPPAGVVALDVPRDLLEAGRFGGPARAPEPFPARPVILFVVVPVVALLVAPVLLLWRWRRRHRFPRSVPPASAWTGPPGGREPPPPYPHFPQGPPVAP